MKKISICFLLLIIFGASVLSAMNKEQTDAWMSILGEKDMQVKLEKLEEYYKTYADKTDETNARYMYLNLADTTYQLQQFDKTIQYGEKALLYKEIEASNKLRIYLFLANAYNLTKKDLDKSYSYADLVIELAKSLRLETQSNITINNNFIAPALRIQVQLILSKPQDVKNTILAFNKALEAYKLDNSEKSSNFVLFLSERMIKLNQVEGAIKGLEIINREKPNADYFRTLGIWYARLKNMDKAIENLKASYQMKKNGKVAYDLGVLLNKTDIDSAMNYLAESNLLNDEKYSPKALELLQHLFFNIKSKGQLPEEQEKGFQEILLAAKTRLGITPTLSDTE